MPRAGLLAANSLTQTSRIIAGLLGTAASGVLIGALGVFWPAFTLDALTFFSSALLIGRIATSSWSGDLIGIRNVFVVAGGIGICAGLAAAGVFRSRPNVAPAPSVS